MSHVLQTELQTARDGLTKSVRGSKLSLRRPKTEGLISGRTRTKGDLQLANTVIRLGSWDIGYVGC
jgi:hypothetical protein